MKNLREERIMYHISAWSCEAGNRMGLFFFTLLGGMCNFTSAVDTKRRNGMHEHPVFISRQIQPSARPEADIYNEF